MKKFLGILIFFFLSLWAIKPLIERGFFPMHDDTQVARVYEMAKALQNGQFPVRWVPDLGYGFGYPIFNFYSPLPYYFGAIFVLFGFDALIATKLMFITGIILGGLFMYFLAKEFWGESGGIISSLFFIYAPYHAVQIYVRGAVGEFWATSFLPLVVFGFCKAYQERKWQWILLGSLGYAAVILSHNITAMILTLFLILTLIIIFINGILKKNLFIFWHFLFIVLLGLALSTFYWLPAITEARFVNIESLIKDTNNFRLHFLCPWQLWNSSWGFGGSALGCDFDGMSFKIGKLHLLLTVIGIVLTVFFKKGGELKRKMILLFSFYLAISIFMTTEASNFIWEIIPFFAYIQYPWRFLIFIIFFTSFLSGIIFSLVRNTLLKSFLFLSLIIALLFFNIKYFQPQNFLRVDSSFYINEEVLKWRTSKISDEYLPKDFPRPKEKEDIPQIAEFLKNKPLMYNFKVNNPGRIFANLISLITLSFIGVLCVKKKN